MKEITITQKELDKKLNEVYLRGVDRGRALFFKHNSTINSKAVKLIDALIDYLDHRYEPIKEID